jgi:hypothetical protein
MATSVEISTFETGKNPALKSDTKIPALNLQKSIDK